MCKQKQIISTGVVRIKEIKRFLYLLPLLLCQAMRTSPRPLPPGLPLLQLCGGFQSHPGCMSFCGYWPITKF
jgi:hypothetical protein